MNRKFFFVYLISFLLFAISIKNYAMLCPTNFNSIEIGDSVDQIIKMCGYPDERNDVNEVMRYSTDNTIDQNNNSVFKNVKEKIVIHTRFIYHFPQPAALIFKDGILTERILLS